MIDELNQFDFDAFRGFLEAHEELIDRTFGTEFGNLPKEIFRLVFDATILVGTQQVRIRCGIDHQFPASLPIFQMLASEGGKLIPHVGPRGEVCYQEREGLVIDHHFPNEIFDYALHKVEKLLKESKSEAFNSEFLDEISYYWERLENATEVLSILDPSVTRARKVTLLTRLLFTRSGKIATIYILGESQKVLDEFVPKGELWQEKRVYSKVWLVPLETIEGVSLPSWSRFWNSDELEHTVYPRLSSESKEVLKRNRNEKLRNVELLILSLPLQNRSRAFVGVRIETLGFRRASENTNQFEFIHPLVAPKRYSALSPVVVRRIDKRYLVERGGGESQLDRKHVLVIGCGAVGSIAAMELAKAGVSELTLVDFDRISVDNSHRHLLGFYDTLFGEAKVHLVKRRIEQNLLHIKVNALPTSLENLLRLSDFDILKYDLVFCATGDPTAELLLNRWIKSQVQAPPVIYAWVEVLGIGGHALLTNHMGKPGCLHCLYTPMLPGGDTGYHNRASFAAPEQFFAKTIAGCGNRFTPFSSLDATRSAIEAVRLAVKCLTGKEDGNPLISWKGDVHAFTDLGYQLSPRYSLNEAELDARKYQYVQAGCEICSHTNQ